MAEDSPIFKKRVLLKATFFSGFKARALRYSPPESFDELRTSGGE